MTLKLNFQNWISKYITVLNWPELLLVQMFEESPDFRRTGFLADFRTIARLCILEVLGFAQRGRIVPTGVFLLIFDKK